MAAGRPSKYKKSYCKRIVELSKEGQLPIMWCADLMVSKQTLHEWRGVHPEFSDAYDLAKSIAEAKMTEKGNSGDALDLNKAKFFLSAAFQVSETQKREIEQKIDTTITKKIRVSFGDREE